MSERAQEQPGQQADVGDALDEFLRSVGQEGRDHDEYIDRVAGCVLKGGVRSAALPAIPENEGPRQPRASPLSSRQLRSKTQASVTPAVMASDAWISSSSEILF